MDSEFSADVKVLVVGAGCEESLSIARRLKQEDLRVSEARCGDPAAGEIETDVYDTVLLFACADGEKGLRLLSRARAQHTYAEFVVVAHDKSPETAVKALQLGALDYLIEPVLEEVIVAAIQKAIHHSALNKEVARLRRRLSTTYPGGLIGQSRGMEQVLDLMERVAPTRVSVLVSGETGTGKELVSRAIHDLSPRRRKGFVPVSCATVPEHIMESLLFGHVRGAFTGAVDNRQGLFEQSPGGTIFLDEIDALGVSLQAKLLRVLEERTIQRVGDRHDIPVDFRLISASNADLEQEMDKGNFREDLYFRLNAFPIRLPPLRERPEDIPLLAIHFRDRFAQENEIEPQSIEHCCMGWLQSYPWPGNVRELKNTIERAMLMSLGQPCITCDSLQHISQRQPGMSWSHPLTEQWSLKRVEEVYTNEVLRLTEGHKGKAAEILGIDRRTLYRKLREREVLGTTDPAQNAHPPTAESSGSGLADHSAQLVNAGR